jgi:hypothetical protein
LYPRKPITFLLPLHVVSVNPVPGPYRLGGKSDRFSVLEDRRVFGYLGDRNLVVSHDVLVGSYRQAPDPGDGLARLDLFDGHGDVVFRVNEHCVGVHFRSFLL